MLSRADSHPCRFSAVHHLSFFSTAPPPLGDPEVLPKFGPQPPPSARIVAVDETHHSAVSRWSKARSAKTMVALSSLPTSAVMDLATLMNSCRPREPPEPPDPPDILLPSPPSLSSPVSWSFRPATPVLAIGSPPWSLSLAESDFAGKAQSIHILPVFHHRRIKPSFSPDLTGTRSENSESPRCRILSLPGSVSLRLWSRDYVSHLLDQNRRRPTFSPLPRSHISVPSNQYLVGQNP